MGLRLAIVGKGGVGKTTIAGTLARLIARRGRRTLALDLDPNPGLAWTLGIPPSDDLLPERVAEHEGAGRPPSAWRLVPGVEVEEAVERFASTGPDGVRYLSAGKILGPAFLDDTSMFGVREIVRGLSPDWNVVADIDAATAVSCGRHLQFAEHLLLVVTPQPASAITVRRLQDLLVGRRIEVVGSMLEDAGPADLAPIARVPFDRCVREADRSGLALLDAHPDAPSVAVLEALADRLLAQEPAAQATGSVGGA